MQLPRSAVERQRQQTQKHRQAKPEIRRGVSLPAKKTQQVIVQPQRQAQGPGAKELQRLRLEGVLHQPSSRRRNPPCLGAPSYTMAVTVPSTAA